MYQDCDRYWDGEARRRLRYGDQPLVFENLMTVDGHKEHRWVVDYLRRRMRRRPREVVLVHGERQAREALRREVMRLGVRTRLA